MLTSYNNVIGIQEKGKYTFKFWTTSRTVTDTDVQGVYVLKSIDKDNNPHYMLLTAMKLIEKEYENYDEALLITPLETIDPKYVKGSDEENADVDGIVMEKYKDVFIKVQ
jgi:hypothetical protein